MADRGAGQLIADIDGDFDDLEDFLNDLIDEAEQSGDFLSDGLLRGLAFSISPDEFQTFYDEILPELPFKPGIFEYCDEILCFKDSDTFHNDISRNIRLMVDRQLQAFKNHAVVGHLVKNLTTDSSTDVSLQHTKS